jgi:hypothetical protein
MTIKTPPFLAANIQFSHSDFIPFGVKPWSTSTFGQVVSSDEHGLYFEGRFEATFSNSAAGFLLLRSFCRSDVSVVVRRFLFLAESILIIRGNHEIKSK